MSEDIYAKPDLSKKSRFQRGETKDEEGEEEERRNTDVCDNTDNVVIYGNCWTEESTPPPEPPDNTTDDQQKTTSVSPSEDIYAKPDLSKRSRFQMSEKKEEEEEEERRNSDIYHYVSNVVTAVDPGPLKRTLPRVAGVFLGLLCLVLLAAVIVLLVLWIQDQNNWNTQRKRLTEDNTDLENQKNLLTAKNNNLTRERDELQSNYTVIESEKNLLMAKNHNLTRERDELQSNNTLIESEKNLLMAKYHNLTTERDELQKQLETHYCLDYWRPFSKSLYLISKNNTQEIKKTWTDSKKFCEDRGAHLVIISNEEEQKFISSFELRVWIGLTDEETEGVWKWVDGTQVTKTYWRSGQPDNRVEHCVMIVQEVYTGNWNDLYCDRENLFICEINL